MSENFKKTFTFGFFVYVCPDGSSLSCRCNTMKKLISLGILLMAAIGFSQTEDLQAQIDSIENTFTYRHGTVELAGGIGKIVIPKGFKYLDTPQATRVLVDLWGNPSSENLTMGLIVPENQGVMGDKGYVFNIQYDEIGYVEDADADEIDYAELLAQMQEESVAENAEREKQGYGPIKLIGWAAKPYYDKEKKILHWAKEIQFGTDSITTLNYNVRVLGRRGVLVLNAIAASSELPLVKRDIHHVLNIVQFGDGYKYSDFNPEVDEVAAWTIGGLVAGKVMAKAGLFAILLKFGKFIAIGAIALFGLLRNRIAGLFGKKQEAEPLAIEAADPAPQNEES